VYNFFTSDYRELIIDFLDCYDRTLNQTINKDVHLLVNIQQTLTNRIAILEQKESQIEEYCTTLEDEISNSTKLKQFR
jgi:hypothetical protein